jgi:putative chitinase
MLTKDRLKQVFVDAPDPYLQQVADELNADLARCGLETPLRQAHFFAQIREEAGGALAGKVENLNYAPDVLKRKFSYYMKFPAEAVQDGYARDPVTRQITRAAHQQAIANKIYAGRIGNGNVASGDGWKFRGRGFIQVTGRANYADTARQYAGLYGAPAPDFAATPELMESFPHTLRSAVCFWVAHGLPELADLGDTGAHVDAITQVINFNTDSYDKRRAHFQLARSVFK